VGEQGYAEISGKGFGYFWDKETLRNFLHDHPTITRDQLIGLYYIAGTQTLEDTTPQLQEEFFPPAV
jgi:uncharacterized protein YneF (UPF0154 family)